VEQWEKVIKNEEVAVMGWSPDTNPAEHKYGKRMGDLFAGNLDPSIRIGDTILIGHSPTHKNVVAVGVVDSNSSKDYSYLEWNGGEPVQMRRLWPFKWLKGMSIPPALDLPLERTLSKLKNYAMTMKPLDVEDPDIKRVCKWMDQKLEDEKMLEAKRGKHGRGEEGIDHKMLKEWCANNPRELGLSNVLSVLIDSSPCGNETADAADVIFEMRGGRYAVIEVETSNALPGAYQALKYKTLLCAHQAYPVTDNRVKAKLVAWEIPDDVRDFCNQYGIDCHPKRLEPKTV
jgi:hypothetical protein